MVVVYCPSSFTPTHPPPVRVLPLHRWMDESFVNSYLIVADGKKGFASGNLEILGLWGMWSSAMVHGWDSKYPSELYSECVIRIKNS